MPSTLWYVIWGLGLGLKGKGSLYVGGAKEVWVKWIEERFEGLWGFFGFRGICFLYLQRDIDNLVSKSIDE